MSLSPMVEYLLAQEKSPGQRLVFISGMQIIVEAYPPNAATNFYLEPRDGEYAYIVYEGLWDPTMVPLASTAFIQHYGIRTFDGFYTQLIGLHTMDDWMVVTAAQKLLTRVTSRSNLNQMLVGKYFWLTVKTAEDYALVREAIKQYGESARSQELHQEANRLLGQLLQAVSRPTPLPLGPRK